MCKEEGLINSLREFRRLTIGQIRFFIRKQKEYEDKRKRLQEVNRRLRDKERGR